MDEHAGKPSISVLERAGEHEPERLGGLLRRYRARIAPERASLGQCLRLPMRVGKAVTQDEIAEAVGISRQWYAMMESDRPVRVSATVLGRIADALMMPPTDRVTLFGLAVPELRSASLTERSTAMLDAFGSFRGLTRQLWAATTETEALTLVREHAMTQLAPEMLLSLTRVAPGRWEGAATDDYDRVRQFHALIHDRWGDAVVDDLNCYTILDQPGDLITRAERDERFPTLAAKAVPTFYDLGRADLSFAMANVRSRRGFIARLMLVHNAAHEYSAFERAYLSTLADLTSLALSGCD